MSSHFGGRFAGFHARPNAANGVSTAGVAARETGGAVSDLRGARVVHASRSIESPDEGAAGGEPALSMVLDEAPWKCFPQVGHSRAPSSQDVSQSGQRVIPVSDSIISLSCSGSRTETALAPLPRPVDDLAPKMRKSTFDARRRAAFLRRTGKELDADVISEQVLRREAQLGPVALHDEASVVLALLDPSHFPKGKDGFGLRLLDEHRSQPGFASGTTAHHMTAIDIVIPEFLPPARGWLEWATEDVTGKVVLIRYCIAFSDVWPDAEDLKPPDSLERELLDAIATLHGPGKQHRKKHKTAHDRSTSWELPQDALLTIGAFEDPQFEVSFIVIELVDRPAAERLPYLRHEVLAV